MSDARMAQCLAIFALATVLCREAHGQTREIENTLASQQRLFQLRVVSGRICATGPASHQSFTSSYTGTKRRERLSIDLSDGLPSVTYEHFAHEGKIGVEIVRGDRVGIQQVPRSAAEQPTVNFVQPRHGALRLTVTIGEESTDYVAPSMWHLLVMEPDVCREHLVPLLEIMRPDWRLAEQAEELEELLCAGDAGRPPDRHDAWQSSIEELASPHYADRERAQQQLLDAGPIVLPFLRSQNRAALDAEQSFRLRRIIRSLTGGGEEDSPQRVAASLAEDASVWFALLDRDDAAVRRKATHKLSRALGVAIDFEPDAQPEVRRDQRDRLREQFADILVPALSEEAADAQ